MIAQEEWPELQTILAVSDRRFDWGSRSTKSVHAGLRKQIGLFDDAAGGRQRSAGCFSSTGAKTSSGAASAE